MASIKPGCSSRHLYRLDSGRTVATYFLSGASRPTSPHIEHLQELLAKWDHLSPADQRAAADLLGRLASDSAER